MYYCMAKQLLAQGIEIVTDQAFREKLGEKTKEGTTFGRILRFWRTTFGKSQEDLSWEVGISTRHISFLESGRALPGRTTVLLLAQAFKLGLRDTNNMLVAAGFFPQHQNLSEDHPELKRLHKSLIITMRGRDPHPTTVHDPYGNIMMVNKAWLRFFTDNSQPGAVHKPLNSYRLYFCEEGLRPYLINWDTLSCAILMALQQEVLLKEDPAALQILEELLTYPNIPPDWKRRAVSIPFSSYYTVNFRLKDNSMHSYHSVSSTVGASPYISEPRLLVHSIYPRFGSTYSTLEELENDDSLIHPLLYY
jgi:transcriptional regulator with XRE-family HTH domain